MDLLKETIFAGRDLEIGEESKVAGTDVLFADFKIAIENQETYAGKKYLQIAKSRSPHPKFQVFNGSYQGEQVSIFIANNPDEILALSDWQSIYFKYKLNESGSKKYADYIPLDIYHHGSIVIEPKPKPTSSFMFGNINMNDLEIAKSKPVTFYYVVAERYFFLKNQSNGNQYCVTNPVNFYRYISEDKKDLNSKEKFVAFVETCRGLIRIPSWTKDHPQFQQLYFVYSKFPTISGVETRFMVKLGATVPQNNSYSFVNFGSALFYQNVLWIFINQPYPKQKQIYPDFFILYKAIITSTEGDDLCRALFMGKHPIFNTPHENMEFISSSFRIANWSNLNLGMVLTDLTKKLHTSLREEAKWEEKDFNSNGILDLDLEGYIDWEERIHTKYGFGEGDFKVIHDTLDGHDIHDNNWTRALRNQVHNLIMDPLRNNDQRRDHYAVEVGREPPHMREPIKLIKFLRNSREHAGENRLYLQDKKLNEILFYVHPYLMSIYYVAACKYHIALAED